MIGMWSNQTLLAMDGLILVSFWKPLVLLATLCGWAWIVSNVYDKHAARFFLPRENWNLAHLCVGLVAVVVGFGLPIAEPWAFFVSWPAMTLLLIGSLAAYAIAANRDERVPENFKIGLRMLSEMQKKREAKKAVKSLAVVKLAIRGMDKQLVQPPQAETPEYEVRAAAEDVYIKAMLARASQVDLTPGKDQTYLPVWLVDGVKSQGEATPAAMAVKIMDFWKSCAKLDVNDRRRKLTGDLVVEKDGAKHKVRLTSIGVTGGMRLTMLFDPDIAVKRAATDLGLLNEKEPLNQLETLRAIVADEKRGVVVLAGLPDGGRTTTMYTIAAMHDAYTQSVQTVEFEPQLQLEGVRHQAFDAQAEGADFGTMVRSMLRRDPDVLAVAEVPDANTAKEIAKSDNDRTRVYACVRSESAVAAVEGYVRAVGDNALAAKGLRGVVAGRLLRRLCPNCKVEYAPAPELVKKLTGGEAKVERLYKKGGQVLIKNKPEVCPTCGGGGYLGQEGIFEVFPIGDEERELIAAGNFPGLKAAFRKRGMPSIAQAAIRKALMGITSVEEVQRATTGPAPAAQGAAAAPAKA